MKTRLFFIASLVILVFLLSTGFQCGSTEMTSARLYIQRSEWDNALKNLEAEVAKNPNNEEAWYLLGRVRAEKRDFAGMREAFAHAMQVGQTYATEIHDVTLGYWARHLNAGVEAFNKGRDTAAYYDKAIREFEIAATIMPDSAAAYKDLAFAYLSKGELTKAIGPLEKAFSISKDPISGRYIGEIYNDLGAPHRAKFEDPSNRIEIRIWMSPVEVRDLLGEPTSKSTTKEKKLTKEKWVYASKNLTLNFEDGQLKSWEEGSRKEEREPKVYYKDYAERDSAMKYYEKSIAALEKVRKLDPHDPEVIALLSNVYIAAERAETALETFKSGVEADPNNKFFRYNYGVLLLKVTGTDSAKAQPALASEYFEKAIDQFRAALAIDSTYEAALYNVGVSYVNWGVHIRETADDPSKVEAAYKDKFKRALPYLERMTRMKPEDAETLEMLGKVYANLGMSKEATAIFQKADRLRK
jgi:tetratricopeptide (TPR) repeat protein